MDLNLDLDGLEGIKFDPGNFDQQQFVDDLETGVKINVFPPGPGRWRASSLVYLWAEKCEKMLLLYLLSGKADPPNTQLQKIFDMGHSVHDLVKRYFAESSEFEVIADELPVRHKDLPITGTMDHVVTWSRFPGQEFIVDIKSCSTDVIQYAPFKKHRWQIGLYSMIYGAPPILVYYDKNNGNIVPYLLSEDQYKPEVEEILKYCRKVWNAYQKLGANALPYLMGTCKRKPKKSCYLHRECDAPTFIKFEGLNNVGNS